MYNILYSINVDNIFDIFSSKARVKILRTLYFQPQPIPLRHIAYISDIPVFSVQTAIILLLDEKMLNRTEKGNYVLFELNRDHPLYAVLEQFFIIELQNRIQTESKTYCHKAKLLLEFVNSANIIFQRTKKKRNVR